MQARLRVHDPESHGLLESIHCARAALVELFLAAGQAPNTYASLAGSISGDGFSDDAQLQGINGEF